MATCKDCLHIGICPNLNHDTVADKCPDFKDSSRFVELPCKPGDRVYRFCGTKNNRYVGERPVHSVTLYGDGSFVILSSAYDTMGKTVFLTREEAEAELTRRTANG